MALDWSSLAPNDGTFRWTSATSSGSCGSTAGSAEPAGDGVRERGADADVCWWSFSAVTACCPPEATTRTNVRSAATGCGRRRSTVVLRRAGQGAVPHVRGDEELTFAELVSRVRTMPPDEVAKRGVGGHRERRTVGPLRLRTSGSSVRGGAGARCSCGSRSCGRRVARTASSWWTSASCRRRSSVVLGVAATELPRVMAWAWRPAGAGLKGRLVRVAAWRKVEKHSLTCPQGVRGAPEAARPQPGAAERRAGEGGGRARSLDLPSCRCRARSWIPDGQRLCSRWAARPGYGLRHADPGGPASATGCWCAVLPDPLWATVDELIDAMPGGRRRVGRGRAGVEPGRPDQHKPRALISRIAPRTGRRPR